MTMAATLMAAVGLFSSCSKDDKGVDERSGREANTYAMVTIALNGQGGMRGDQNETDYSTAGKWEGIDKIESFTIYLADLDASPASSGGTTTYTIGNGTVHRYKKEANEYFKGPHADGKTVYYPKEAFATTAGEKLLYVVVNETEEIKNYLGATSSNDKSTFTTKEFRDRWEALKNGALQQDGYGEGNSGMLVATHDANVDLTKVNYTDNKTEIEKIAKYSDTETSDRIVMTSFKENRIEVKKDVKAQDAMRDGGPNRFNSQVKRVVARVIVTTDAGTFKVYERGSNDKVLGTVGELKFAVAQGGRGFIPGQPMIEENGTNYFFTPGFKFVPNTNVFATWYEGMGKWYDYSGLFDKKDITQKAYTNKMDELKDVAPVFIFPNNHVIGDSKNTGFKKANTAYVLVKGIFTPDPSVKFADEELGKVAPEEKKYKVNGVNKSWNEILQANQDEEAVDGKANGEKTFYIGANGKFYKTKTGAISEELGGVKDQKVTTYLRGAVYYYAWLNPNDPSKALNSPVLRNNVYHIHINGIKAIGYNWNPLYPEKPEKEDPNNPDPNPDKGGTPIDPNDNLSKDDIYMSVTVEVLDWDTHSYKVDLDI